MHAFSSIFSAFSCLKAIAYAFHTKISVDTFHVVLGYWRVDPPVKHSHQFYAEGIESGVYTLAAQNVSVGVVTGEQELCEWLLQDEELSVWHLQANWQRQCHYLPYEKLPHEEEANSVALECTSKYGKELPSGYLRKLNRIWLSKYFVAAKAYEWFGWDGWDYVMWIDAGTVDPFTDHAPFRSIMESEFEIAKGSEDDVFVLQYSNYLTMPQISGPKGSIDGAGACVQGGQCHHVPMMNPSITVEEGRTYQDTFFDIHQASLDAASGLAFGNARCAMASIQGGCFMANAKGFARGLKAFNRALNSMVARVGREQGQVNGCVCFDEEIAMTAALSMEPEVFSRLGVELPRGVELKLVGIGEKPEVEVSFELKGIAHGVHIASTRLLLLEYSVDSLAWHVFQILELQGAATYYELERRLRDVKTTIETSDMIFAEVAAMYHEERQQMHKHLVESVPPEMALEVGNWGFRGLPNMHCHLCGRVPDATQYMSLDATRYKGTMSISPTLKIVYLPIFKAGSESAWHYLDRQSFYRVENWEDLEPALKQLTARGLMRLPAEESNEAAQESLVSKRTVRSWAEDWVASCFIFTIVRNPLHRAISAFYEILQDQRYEAGVSASPLVDTPEAYMRYFDIVRESLVHGPVYEHALPQVFFTSDKKGVMWDINFVVRMERLEADWALMRERAAPKGMPYAPPKVVAYTEEQSGSIRMKDIKKSNLELWLEEGGSNQRAFMRQLCNFYWQDYMCFGYDLPHVCKLADDATPA